MQCGRWAASKQELLNWTWPIAATLQPLTSSSPRSPLPSFLPACPQFKDVAVKVKAAETLYKGITFYLEEHPDLLNDLLKVGGRACWVAGWVAGWLGG